MLKTITNPDVLKNYPGGRVSQCTLCGTMLRVGQPHTAVAPVPHTSFEMLTVVEPEMADRHYAGEQDFSAPARPHGRKVYGKLVKDNDSGYWREEAL